MIRTRQLRDLAPSVDGDTLTVRLIEWDTPSNVTDNGRDFYSESFVRGGLVPDDRLLAEVEHDGVVVGRGIGTDDRDDGLYADVRISQSTAGRDFLADVDAGIYEAVSIDFDDDPRPVKAGDRVQRTGARLRRFAFTTDPAHAGSRIVGRRSKETPDMKTKTKRTNDEHDSEHDDEHDDELDDDDEDQDDVDDTDGGDDAGDAPPAGQRSRRSAPRPGRRVGGARAGGRFRSFGHFALAAAKGEVHGDELARYQRALATTTSGAQTGLVHEEWIREVIDLQKAVQPTVEMFSSRPLPDSGDSVKQPKVTTRAVAAEQVTENTEIASQAVVITPVTWELETFAGGQGMSLQAVLRSSPEYLNEVNRLHLEALALEVNQSAAADVVAAVPAPQVIEMTDTFNVAVNAAVAGMYGTLRQFPSFILLSTSLWQALADLEDTDGRPIYPGLGVVGAMGTVSLQSDSGQQRDLGWRIEPELPTDTAIVAHREAYRTFAGPVQTLTADVPSTLSRDVAVFQFVAKGVTDTRGLYQIGPETP